MDVPADELVRALQIGARALKKAALSEEAKQFVLQHEPLFRVLKKAAARYTGGETLPEALACLAQLNRAGYAVTTDYMGESTRTEAEARAATAEFVRLAAAIGAEQLNSSLSLDLSHIGLLVSRELVLENLALICRAAQASRQEVILSMEGADRTDQILDIYQTALQTHPNLGITVQAYLHRTADDLPGLLRLSGSIRLVKGAYDTPPGHALARGPALDECYLRYAADLLQRNHPCAIASHHELIHREAARLIAQYQPTRYVLERLLGIRNEELDGYRVQGYNCRIYVVYGQEWYLYVCNRWAEYPLDVFRGLADLVA